MNRTLIWFLLLLGSLVVLSYSALQSNWLRDQVLTRGLDAATESWQLERAEGNLLHGLTLHGLRLELAAATIELDRFDLQPAFERLLWGRLAIRHIVLTRPRIELHEVTTTDDTGASAAELDLYLPLSVQIAHLAVHELELHQDGAPLIQGLSTSLSLTAQGSRLSVDDFRLVWPDQRLRVSGGGTLSMVPDLPLTAGLDLTRYPASEQEPPVHLQLIVNGDMHRIDGRAELQQPTSGLVRFTLEPESLAFRLDGDVAALTWPDPELAATLEQLTFSAQGDPEAIDWSISGRGAWDEVPASLDGRGRLTPERLEIESAAIGFDALAGQLSGRLDLTGEQAFMAELAMQDLDVSHWFPDWPSRLQLDTRIEGRLPGEQQPLAVQVPRLQLRGDWNAVPARLDASLSATLEGDDSRLQISHLELSAGRNELDLTGELSDRIQLDLDARLQDLGQLWPGLEGALTATAQATGERISPRLVTRGHAEQAGYEGLQAKQLSWDGEIDLRAEADNRMEISLTGLTVADTRIDSDLQLSGSWPRLAMHGNTRMKELDVRVDHRLGFDAEALDRIELQQLDLGLPLVGDWSLESAMELSWDLAASAARLSAACLRQAEDARLCWQDAYLHPEDSELDLTLETLDLELLRPYLPPTLQVDGALDLRVGLRGTTLSGELTGDSIMLSVLDPDLDEMLFEDELQVLQLDFGHREGELNADLQARAISAGRIQWTATLLSDPEQLQTSPAAALLDAALTSRLDLAIDELAPFTPLIPGPARAEGGLQGTLHLSGTLAEPAISGFADLEGRLALLNLGLELDPLQVSISTLPGSAAQLTGSATIDGQTVQLLGSLDWLGEDGPVAEATLTGDRIPLALGPELSLVLTPNLQLRYDDSGARLSGRAVVPEARIRVQALPEGGGDTLSADVVIHHDNGETVAERALPFWLDLEVVLGDQVRLSASGLETRLAGRLRLRQSPEFPLSAQGQLQTRDGAFNAYGQDLTIQRGRLDFDGPLDNPAVDVLAIRRVGDAEVGIQVSGFAYTLETRLHSAPPRDDAEALTMLITGREPGEASSADMDRVSEAALAFGLGQATPVLGRLVNQLGIDELALDSPLDEDTGAILVGTQVTDDIYIRYTYGLHTRVGGLLIEYRLTDWLSVQSETGTTQAIDLIFRREIR